MIENMSWTNLLPPKGHEKLSPTSTTNGIANLKLKSTIKHCLARLINLFCFALEAGRVVGSVNTKKKTQNVTRRKLSLPSPLRLRWKIRSSKFFAGTFHPIVSFYPQSFFLHERQASLFRHRRFHQHFNFPCCSNIENRAGYPKDDEEVFSFHSSSSVKTNLTRRQRNILTSTFVRSFRRL